MAQTKATPELAEHAARRVLDLTRKMAEAAAARDWEAVARLHRERDPVLRHLCESNLLGRERLEKVLRQVLAMDRETALRVELAREETRLALQRFGRGRRAVEAYHGTVRGRA